MADAPPPNESSEDYAAAHALEYKNRGNAKFKERDYEGAVQAFSEAIALDPSNAVLYSNRSGAYLAMSHVSKAFKDAEEAVRLDPQWPKALARRATAEHALTRYITAQATWRKALQLDPGNEAYEKALQAAKDGEAQQTKERIEDEKRKEREAEEKRRRDAADEAKRREDARNEEQLKDFFGVLEDDKVQRARKKKLETNPITEKYQKQKLGKGADHKRDRTILVIEGARERCRQERAFKLSKGVDPATLPPEEEALQKEVAKTFAQNEMKRRDVEEHNRVQQQRERDQAAEAEKKEADEKLFEKQWNTDDRRGARVGMWQDFQDDKKRSANVKRQRTAVNFKREEKQETKKKYGEWDRESWRRDWK
ncbi:unnamed protein product [Pelagomonas calceolata]|uniref:RNA-polymerase II-associated protein 3-like C-terminal domain-containing protein n=1 Tax=Pelagomonas calceolata TaxID=35677 RepID=A0A8J2S2R7_9STRA|nr:unnamed protein product [Pelagomonas calceolata]